MKKYIDLTVMLDENYLPYPGDESIKFRQVKSIISDGYNLTRIETGMHIGTHIDARKHIIKDGEGIEVVNLDELIGKARVIRPAIIDNLISTKDIAAKISGDEQILLLDLLHANKLNSDEYYNQPKFQRDIMQVLIRYNIKVIGFDIPSPEYLDGDFLDMHKDLMKSNILIIENLTNLNLLSDVVDFIGLPLKIKGMDGSLMRCVGRNIDC